MRPIDPTRPILIVEDSDDDFEVTERAFKKTGNLSNPIYRACDGQEALDFLFHEGKYSNPLDAPRPGIILLDLNMPGLDGRAVLSKVKATPELNDIPIVVLTTSDNETDIEDCYNMGANTYIKKPVELSIFLDAIQSLKNYWFGIALLPKGDANETAT